MNISPSHPQWDCIQQLEAVLNSDSWKELFRASQSPGLLYSVLEAKEEVKDRVP